MLPPGGLVETEALRTRGGCSGLPMPSGSRDLHYIARDNTLHLLVQERSDTRSGMQDREGSQPAIPNARHGGSREAIVSAAQRLFLEHGFGAVSMDDLAEAAGVARRTLYNQFASKEEIFREMLLSFSSQLENAFPPGIETQGDVEEVLRLIARAILDLHARPGYLGFLRMVVADSRQFPWIAEAFAAVMEPQTERLVRYLRHLTEIGILDCRKPTLAAHQFTGTINEFFLWPWMLGREGALAPEKDVVEEAVGMFLQRYRVPRREIVAGRGAGARRRSRTSASQS
jgi:TetR/AcrR family transcriptional regulator, regulator of autoinduction and epiphytic fitness